MNKRINALIEHHEKRLNEIKKDLRLKDKSVYEVSSSISWDSRPWEEMNFWTKRMAALETYAHLIYLQNESDIKEKIVDGVLIYSLS